MDTPTHLPADDQRPRHRPADRPDRPKPPERPERPDRPGAHPSHPIEEPPDAEPKD